MSSSPASRVVASAFALLALAAGGRAHACATCGCGDPTLTAVGVEKPYKNRLRVSVEERVGSRSTGSDLMRMRTTLTQSLLGVAYTPHPRVTLATFLPLVANFQRSATGQDARIVGLGDLQLQARVLVVRDRAFAPRHLVWLLGGVQAPTAPRLRDDAGYFYSDDDQPGSGAWAPMAGLTYAWFGGPVTLYSSVLYRHPTPGPREYQLGSSFLSSTVAQLQPWPFLAFQLGGDLRYAWADHLANGADAPNTGGFVAALVPGVITNPWRDLLLRLGVEVPIYQSLRGVQAVGPQIVLAVSYDVL